MFTLSLSRKHRPRKHRPHEFCVFETPIYWSPYWRTRLCNFVGNISTNISTLRQRTHLKVGELSSLFTVYNIKFFDFIQCMVFYFVFFYCVTMHTLYWLRLKSLGNILRTLECRGSLLWTVAVKWYISSLKLVLLAFRNLADLRNVYERFHMNRKL